MRATRLCCNYLTAIVAGKQQQTTREQVRMAELQQNQIYNNRPGSGRAQRSACRLLLWRSGLHLEPKLRAAGMHGRGRRRHREEGSPSRKPINQSQPMREEPRFHSQDGKRSPSRVGGGVGMQARRDPEQVRALRCGTGGCPNRRGEPLGPGDGPWVGSMTPGPLQLCDSRRIGGRAFQDTEQGGGEQEAPAF